MSINTNSTPTMSGAPRRFGRNALLAAIGGGVALAAVVGAGLWVRNDRRESSAPAEAVAVQPSFNTTGAPVGAASVPTDASQALNSRDVFWIYIVASESEAASLLNAATHVPGSPFKVVVVGSIAEAEYDANLLLGLNPVRPEAGQPQVKVVMAGSLAAD